MLQGQWCCGSGGLRSHEEEMRSGENEAKLALKVLGKIQNRRRQLQLAVRVTGACGTQRGAGEECVAVRQ